MATDLRSPPETVVHTSSGVKRVRISPKMFAAMIEAGVIREGQRIQLIDGELFRMPAMNDPRWTVLNHLINLGHLRRSVPPKHQTPETRHFLRYWKPEAVDDSVEFDGLFGHSAGNQHRWNRPGDVLWLVTVRAGDLQLVGRMVVWKVMSWDEAVDHFEHDEFWEADYHAVAKRGTESPYVSFSITALADQLRFQSPSGRDRLVVADGRIPAQQLQTMRQLTAASVDLLQEAWTSTLAAESKMIAEGETEASARGAGFGSPENNRQVERAAEDFVADWYREEGWEVDPVGFEGRGYDLECAAENGQVHHVEVKGISGNLENFIIYRSGLERAKSDPSYRLYTVLNALDPERRRFTSYKGAELLKKFEFEAKDYFARKR